MFRTFKLCGCGMLCKNDDDINGRDPNFKRYRGEFPDAVQVLRSFVGDEDGEPEIIEND